MKYFKIAKDIDEEYFKTYLIAKKAGVNFLAYRCNVSSKKIFIDKKLKIIDVIFVKIKMIYSVPCFKKFY